MKLIIRIAPILLVIACQTQSGDMAPTESQAPAATETVSSAPVVTDTMGTAPSAPVTGTMSTAPITTTTTASTTPVPSAPVSDNVQRITIDETVRALNAGTAVLVDVRTEEQYKLSHAKGAIHIPEAQIVERMGELPFNKTIITYCAWPNEHTSARAVLNLSQKGLSNAAAMIGGWDAWKRLGLPVE